VFITPPAIPYTPVVVVFVGTAINAAAIDAGSDGAYLLSE
jgi:hypothetical protein